MANIKPKVEFEAVRFSVGLGWFVRVTPPDKKQRQLGRFDTELEAREWIRRRSPAWLKKFMKAPATRRRPKRSRDSDRATRPNSSQQSRQQLT